MRKLLLALLLIAAGAGALFFFKSPRRAAVTEAPQPASAPHAGAGLLADSRTSSSSESVAAALSSQAGTFTQQVNAILNSESAPSYIASWLVTTGLVESPSSTLPPGTVLENMRTTFRSYASAFGENPVCTNPEITRALAGDNPKQIVFLKNDGNRVNAKGELVDPWGTPYFFHQLSGTEMEIRSAGPDKKMWTGDDLVIK